MDAEIHLLHGILCDSSPALEIYSYSLTSLEPIAALEQSASDSPWSTSAIRSSIEAGHLCLGVKSNGAWVAHAIFSEVDEESELLILAVAPSFKRQGVAKALLHYYFSTSGDAARSIYLEVRESNWAAIGLYESLGFVQIGKRKAYYPAKAGAGSREDAVQMSIDIPKARP